MPSIPTYLMNRNGIWYFNYRIPAAVRKRHNIKSRFIRRSLRTSSVRHAVLLSKEYISMVMGDKRSLMNHPEVLEQLNVKFDQCHVNEHQKNDTVISENSFTPTPDTRQAKNESSINKVYNSVSSFIPTGNYSALPYSTFINRNKSGKTSITIGTLIKKYIADKVNKNEWKERTLTANSRMLETIKVFLEYSIGLKSPMIHLFQYEHAELFETTFRKYPKNCKKIFPNQNGS